MAFTPRQLRVPGVIEVAGRHVKRYQVSLHASGVEPALVRSAESHLPALLPDPDGTPPASFAVLHQGEDGSYLNVYSWVWRDVLECRVAVAGLPFLGCPDDDPAAFIPLTRPWVGCVWELPALAHERTAWVRHMLAPEQPDLSGYLADTLSEGPVG